MDALHLASALALRATDFVTTEKRTKPLFRVERRAVDLVGGLNAIMRSPRISLPSA
jgi:hypothetical protein